MVECCYIFEQPGRKIPTPSIIWPFTYFNLIIQLDSDVFSPYSVNITYFMCCKGIQFLILYLTDVLLCVKVIHLSRTQCYLVSSLHQGQKTTILGTH